MGDISSITLPDGSSYDLKDVVARAGIPYSIDTISVVSGAAELHDHAVNVVTVESSSCVFTLPATVHGKSRDFVIHAILSGDAYLTFSSYDAGGGAVSWLNGDQSGTYEQGHVLIGVTESGSAQGSFIGSNLFALDELKKDIAKKYEKPAGGIPSTDIADGVIPEVPEPSDDDPLAAQDVPYHGINDSYSRSDHVHQSEVFVVTCDIDMVNMQASNFSHTFEDILQERNDGRKILLQAKAMVGEQTGGTLFAWLVDEFGPVEDDELTVYQLWFSGFLASNAFRHNGKWHVYYATVCRYVDGSNAFMLSELLDSNDWDSIEESRNNLTIDSPTVTSDSFALVANTSVYRVSASISDGAATIPVPDGSGIPESNAYYCFEMGVSVDASATSLVGPPGWTWVADGELPTSDFAGKTIYISVRLDCTQNARTFLANVWRTA